MSNVRTNETRTPDTAPAPSQKTFGTALSKAKTSAPPASSAAEQTAALSGNAHQQAGHSKQPRSSAERSSQPGRQESNESSTESTDSSSRNGAVTPWQGGRGEGGTGQQKGRDDGTLPHARLGSKVVWIRPQGDPKQLAVSLTQTSFSAGKSSADQPASRDSEGRDGNGRNDDVGHIESMPTGPLPKAPAQAADATAAILESHAPATTAQASTFDDEKYGVGSHNIPPPGWSGWVNSPRWRAQHPKEWFYGPGHKPYRNPYSGLQPGRPGLHPSPYIQRPDPRDPLGQSPIAGLNLAGTGKLPSLGSLSPRWTDLEGEVSKLEGATFRSEMSKIDNRFESNRECLWDGTKLTPAQKARYLFDLSDGLSKLQDYKSGSIQLEKPAFIKNEDAIMRSFRMRMDRLNKDPDLQTYMRTDHMAALSRAIYDLPPIRLKLRDTMKADILDGGILNASLAHGLKPGDAAHAYMREYGLLQSMMTPDDLKDCTAGAAKTLSNFIGRYTSIDHVDQTAAAQMQVYYRMQGGNDIGLLQQTAKPMAEALADKYHLGRMTVASDVATLVNGTVSGIRKGLKAVKALEQAMKSMRWSTTVPEGLRNTYDKGVFMIANAVTSGAALGMKLGVGLPVSDQSKAATAFQAAMVADLGTEGSVAIAQMVGYKRAEGTFSVANLNEGAKLLGGLGGLGAASIGFVTMVQSIKNGDAAKASLDGIGAAAGMAGSTASILEGVMHFSGVTSMDAFAPARGAAAFVKDLVRFSNMGRYAPDFARIGARFAFANTSGSAPSLIIERAGLAILGDVGAVIGAGVALGYLLRDLFVGEHRQKKLLGHLHDDANGAIVRMFGPGSAIQLSGNPIHRPPH